MPSITFQCLPSLSRQTRFHLIAPVDFCKAAVVFSKVDMESKGKFQLLAKWLIDKQSIIETHSTSALALVV